MMQMNPGLHVRWLVLVLSTLCMSACTGVVPMGGDLSLRSRSNDGVRLDGAFATAYYSVDDQQRLTLVLMDGPEQKPERAVTLRMQWRPRAGKTPVDRNAINATIHYAIFSGAGSEQVGIYSGAGFVFPRGELGDDTLRLSLWDSSLRLLDRTPGFNDLLGQAVLTGDFRVEHNPGETRRLIAQLDQLLTQKLGYPRVVDRR